MSIITSTELVKNHCATHCGMPLIVATIVSAYEEMRFVDLTQLTSQAKQTLQKCNRIDFVFFSATPARFASFATEQEESHWLQHTRNLVQSQHAVSSQDILTMLTRHPELSCYYALDAGVSEGYTIREHTALVLDVAHQFRAQFASNVCRHVSWKEFIFFLAFHDLGKGTAKPSQNDALSSSLTFKENELRSTQRLLVKYMEQFKLDPKKIALFKALLLHDTQGLFLKDEITDNDVIDHIYKLSSQCGMRPLHFYQMLVTFHMIDAASYPGLRQAIFCERNGRLSYRPEKRKMTQRIYKKLVMAEKGEQAFQDLLRHKGKIPPNQLKAGFSASLPALKLFLEREHKAMLRENASQAKIAKYKKIKKGFRDLLLYFARTLPNNLTPKQLAQEYAEATHHLLGSGVLNQRNTNLSELLIEQFEIEDDRVKFKELLTELMHFRRNYLCRFSVRKVRAEAGHWLRRIANNNEDVTNYFGDYLEWAAKFKPDPSHPLTESLIRITFLHGTNASLLPNLLMTDLQLIPTGRLLKMGVTPLSGELREGANGVNRYHLSGANLDLGYRALSYSENTLFHVNQNSILKTVNNFLKTISERAARPWCKTIFNDQYDIVGSTFVPNNILAVKRLRMFYPEEYQRLLPTLQATLLALETDWEAFKKTDEYSRSLKAGASRQYWQPHIENVEKAIALLRQVMTEPLHVPQSAANAIRDPFPIIFGSNTLHTNLHMSEDEQPSHGAMRLGTDLQYAFVMPKDRPKMIRFLRENDLEANMQVLEMDDLRKAIVINVLAAHYFADIVSRYKMRCLYQLS